jgi:hypothetical protein
VPPVELWEQVHGRNANVRPRWRSRLTPAEDETSPEWREGVTAREDSEGDALIETHGKETHRSDQTGNSPTGKVAVHPPLL